MTLFRILTLITSILLSIRVVILSHWFFQTPLLGVGKEVQQATTIQLPVGSDIHYLTKNLHQRGLLKHPRFFIFLARLSGDAYLLKAGEYEIVENTTPHNLLKMIISGKVKKHSITFIEGWTFRQVKEELNKNTYLKHTINTLTDEQIMTNLNCSGCHPEGLFFPDTYFFAKDDKDTQILQQAYQRMKTILNEAWLDRSKCLPYKNSYEALIVASLIEKETALSEERPRVAGVILKRLQKKMMLQVDPTILYGLDRPYSDRITKRDLVSNTLYNTYKHYGLPPTPIDMPSRASIVAALHPLISDALFYMSRGDGGHIFSSTYKAHCKAVKKYRDQELMALPWLKWALPYLI